MSLVLEGFLNTVALTLLSFAGALLVGLLVAVLRVVPVPLLRGVGAVYVEVWRNIPLLAWLVLFVFGLPEVGVKMPLFWTAFTAIALYEAAFVAEALRSGVNSVASGQGEAARALGLSFRQSLRHVILPQASKRVVQPLANIAIALTMATALAGVVGVVDMTRAAQRINLELAQPLLVFTGVGLCYLVMAAGIGFGARVLERRLA
ncbi:glutamate transport system permease protein [Lentzea waywayandensis]|uniref:Glutamate transport system permease protein n=1 Tax=Lentzea waywayandensis TaxID=84724 RepID=A0A1I6EYE2_9PSEU|nr:amino acid ABC transporter permease [Lentzea waywayandensis]SFR22684.1 glutamate transport system permease protein [Lentzea waywayandensis]